MKKAISIILAFSMILTLFTGCGKSDKDNEVAEINVAMTAKEILDKQLKAAFDENESFSGGTGTEKDPWLISTADDLFRLAAQINGETQGYVYREAHYRLTGNIDLGNKNWMPIGVGETFSRYGFCGVFDGDGYTVSGMRAIHSESNMLRAITYTVEEIKVEGYETKITGNKAEGFTITNKHETDKTSISVEKVWEDNNDQDGIRPESITVNLLGNGEVVESAELTGDSWSYTFEDLDVNANGEEITYTVEEIKVEGYETKITGNKAEGFTITNKHETDKTSISVEKVWDDNNDQDGIRPESITVNLLGNGEVVESAELTGDSWSYTFEDLDVNANGEEITYTVEEIKVEGYETKISGNKAEGFTITNKHETDKTKTGDDSNLPLHVSLFGASLSALAVLMFLAKSKKKGRHAN